VWPKIAARFQNGETLTEIARSYGCTAPAIRYIVGRVPMRGQKGRKGAIGEVERVPVLPVEVRRTSPLGSIPDMAESRGRSSSRSLTTGIWGRVNTDIATFLAGVDALFSDDSDSNYEALLAATDRLLWASARTRLELERILGSRKKGASIRRLSG
jgi:hypothetical protein